MPAAAAWTAPASIDASPPNSTTDISDRRTVVWLPPPVSTVIPRRIRHVTPVPAAAFLPYASTIPRLRRDFGEVGLRNPDANGFWGRFRVRVASPLGCGGGRAPR